MGTVNFDPGKRWKGPAVRPEDADAVPLALLAAGLLIGFALIVWWAMR